MAFRANSLLPLVLVLGLNPLLSRADSLKITSTPSGAAVEINGVALGTTPYEEEMPGGYFHKTKTTLGRRLLHSITVRISLAGYTTKELLITDGPMNWVSLKGHNHGEYWLITSNHFHVDLDPISKVFAGAISADVSVATHAPEAASQPALPLEDVIATAKASVVRLKGLTKSGSGFFVTEKGVIATNAHLARGETSLLAVLPDGQQLLANIIHVDPDRDIALAKVDGDDYRFLTLAATGNVRQGETVIAIGNPGGAMPFAVTRGIVSAVGKFSAAGPGIWIQTDATINPGNSGGPLLNSRGQVIGINTLKLQKKDVSGIGFAISAADLLAILLKYFPDPNSSAASSGGADQDLLASPVVPSQPKPGPSGQAFGTIEFREPRGAEIFVDGKFVGEIPASMPLAAGETYLIVVRAAGHADWVKRISVLSGMHTVLAPWPPAE